MHPPTEFDLDLRQLGPHPLRVRLATDDVAVVFTCPTTVVGQAQEGEGFRFPFTLLPSIRCSVTTKLDQASFLRMEFQPKGGESFAQLCETSPRFGFTLEADYEVVSITDDDDLATGLGLPPFLDPKVEDVVLVDVA